MLSKAHIRFLVSCACTLVAAGASADVIYVRADLASGLNNGSSWPNAYRGSAGLRAALAEAVPGDEIWVGHGTYSPAEPGGSREASFVMPSGVRLVGGFLGHENNRSSRNMVLNRSILSGDLNGNDAINEDKSDNAAHVMRVTDAGPGTVIDGMTIRSGNARDYSSNNQVQRRDGGGLLVLNSTLEVISSMFERNHADRAGGGMFVQGGSVTVSYSLVLENVSPGLGAGFAATGGAALDVYAVSMVANVGGSGVGIFSGPVRLVSDHTATLRAQYVLFRDHDARIGATAGAGVLSYGPLDIIGCTFDRNQANGGGGVMIVSGGARIAESRFVANKANGDLGDAIHVRGEGDGPGDPAWPMVDVINTQVSGHFFAGFPRADGSPVFLNKGSMRLVNCTVASNGGARSAGAIVVIEGGMIVDNSIVWGNSGPSGTGQAAAFFVSGFFPASLTVNRSLVQGWNGTIAGIGSFNGDPRFVDADGFDDLAGTIDDDFSLAVGSAAIDQGDRSLVPAGVSLDLAGRERFRQNTETPDAVIGEGGPVDSGAFEYQRLCEADFNADGFLDFFDYDLFVQVFELGAYGGEMLADFNRDGFLDFFDYDAFMAAYQAGC